MPITPTSFDNIKVGYISETDGYIQNVSIDQYDFLNKNQVSYQRLKGVDSFMTKLRDISTR